MLLLILFIIILIVIIVLFSIYFLTKEYYPAWTSYSEIQNVNVEQDLYYQVLLPIKSVGEDSLTPEFIKQNLLDCDYNSLVAHLNTLGQVTWESPSGSMVIWKIKAGNIPTQLYSYGSNVITVNNPFYFNYQNKKLILVGLNTTLDKNLTPRTPIEWTNEFGLINQPIGVSPIKIENTISQGTRITDVMGSGGGSIGILWSGNLPSLNMLQKLATDMGYPSNKFSNQLIQMESDPVLGYVILEKEFLEINLNDKVNLDLQAVFSVSPDINCILYKETNNLTLSILWESLKEESLPHIWSSSFSFSEKFTPFDTIRIHQEYKLLALCGINTFQSSGDGGNYSSMISFSDIDNTRVDITKPDTIQGRFDSPFTIKVGAYSNTYPEDSGYPPYNDKISMTLPSDNENTFSNTFYASGGGFSRGQRDDPLWKNKNTDPYRKLYSNITIKQTTNGIISNTDIMDLDVRGNASPDIIGPGNSLTENPISGETDLIFNGTSYAVSYIASMFASLEYSKRDKFIMLCRELHQNPNLMKKTIRGRNNVYNVYGYSTSDSPWDPVQGLGIPDISKLSFHFNPA